MSTAKKTSSNITVGWVVGGTMLALAVAACGRKETPPRAAKPDAPVHVDVVEQSTRPNDIKASGVTAPRRLVALATQVRGVVTKLSVKLGQRVQKGDVLARVSTVGLSGQFRAAKANIHQIQTDLAVALRDARTNKQLLAQGATTRKASEDAAFRVRRLRSQLAGARATLAQIGDSYRGGTVRAPFSGVISSQKVELGDYVNAGQVIGHLVDLSQLLVTTSVAEHDVLRIRPDTGVTLIFPAAAGQRAVGRVHAIAPTADNATGAYTVEVVVPNSTGRLKGGMTAHVVFAQPGERGMFLPSTAVLRRDGKQVVYVLRADRKRVDQRPVTVGTARDGTVHIRSGLGLGEHVVVSGTARLEHGTAVRVVSGVKLAQEDGSPTVPRSPTPNFGALVRP